MMQISHRLRLSILIVAGCAALALPAGANAADAGQKGAGATNGDPAAVVREVSQEVIEALNANEAKLKADPQLARQLVKKYLLPNFDFDLTSQLVLGRYWRTATPEQRAAFKEAFLHYLVTTYAKGLQHYDGAKVEVMPFRGDSSDRYVKVRSQIVLANRPPIEVNYALVKRDAGWKLFDFIIEGVSYVHTYQTEFQSEIRHTSMEALIKRLQSAKAPANATAMKAAMPAPAAASGK